MQFETTLLTADELLAAQRVQLAHVKAAIAVIAIKSGTVNVTEVNINGPISAVVRFEDKPNAKPTTSDLANQIMSLLAGGARVEEERLNRLADPRTMQQALMLCRHIAELNDPTPETLLSRAMVYLQQFSGESRRQVQQLKPSIDKVVAELLQHGTLTGDAVREIISLESAST